MNFCNTNKKRITNIDSELELKVYGAYVLKENNGYAPNLEGANAIEIERARKISESHLTEDGFKQKETFYLVCRVGSVRYYIESPIYRGSLQYQKEVIKEIEYL